MSSAVKLWLHRSSIWISIVNSNVTEMTRPNENLTPLTVIWPLFVTTRSLKMLPIFCLEYRYVPDISRVIYTTHLVNPSHKHLTLYSSSTAIQINSIKSIQMSPAILAVNIAVIHKKCPHQTNRTSTGTTQHTKNMKLVRIKNLAVKCSSTYNIATGHN